MRKSNANSSGNNNQRDKNNTVRGRIWCGRGGRGHGRSGSRFYIIHNNIKKVPTNYFGNIVFEVAKSEQLEQTARILSDSVGNKYGGAARYVIKNHRKKILTIHKTWTKQPQPEQRN